MVSKLLNNKRFKMKVLFITSPIEDYLGDSLLHGLKLLYGADCVDFPKCEILYSNCPEAAQNQVRGKGFTLYSGLLDDVPVDRFRIVQKVKSGFYDLVVIGNIWRQTGWFLELRPYLSKKNCIILDGADTTLVYPAAGRWWRKSYYWLLPKAHRQFLYFKREWTQQTQFSILARLFPSWIRERLPQSKNLRRINFGIPEEKITTTLTEKTKDFPVHIVDSEIAAVVPGSETRYAFSSEADYYNDLKQSRFGITTKRSGWDCLRHYEIAANGAVPCFLRHDDKPLNCAPHGLDSSNSISYCSARDLFAKINALSPQEYQTLQLGALQWARDNTTETVARKVIAEWKASATKQ